MIRDEENIRNTLKEMRKSMVGLRITCGNEEHEGKIARERAEWGISRCDAYSLDRTLGLVISNALLTYLHWGQLHIKMDAEQITSLRRCAKAIREYAEIDSWGGLPTPKRLKGEERKKWIADRKAYMVKAREWKWAMGWLTKNWNSLWY